MEKYPITQRRAFGEQIEKEGAARHIDYPEDYRQAFAEADAEEIRIPTRHGPVRAFVIRRPDLPAPAPVHINIHGGGFIKKHGERDLLFAAQLAKRCSCIVISIDYHTTAECMYPVPFDECYDAAVWVSRHAGEFGGDAGRLTLGGHSAGATMTASAVLRGQAEGTLSPRGQVLDYGNYDLLTPPEQKIHDPSTRLSPRRMKMSVSLLTEDDPEILASPYCSLLQAPDAMLRGLCDTAILSAGKCPFRRENERFADRLEQNGVKVVRRCFEESDHGFVISLNGEWREAQDWIVQILCEMQK